MGSTVANSGLEALVCPQRGTGVPDGCLGANGKEPLSASVCSSGYTFKSQACSACCLGYCIDGWGGRVVWGAGWGALAPR